MNNLANIKKDYLKNGYVIVRKCLDRKSIDLILNNLCDGYFKYNPNSSFKFKSKPWLSQKFHKEFKNFKKKNPETFSEIYDLAQSSVAISKMISSEKITKIASSLLNCNKSSLSHYQNMIRMDTPYNKKNKSAWHQEVQFFYNPGIVFWAPLIKMFQKIGYLKILEKSHLLGEIEYQRNKPSSYATSRLSTSEIPKKTLSSYLKRFKLVQAKLQLGDAVFFGSNLLHSSSDNVSNFTRFSCQTRFFNTLGNNFAPFRPKIFLNPYSCKRLNRKF